MRVDRIEDASRGQCVAMLTCVFVGYDVKMIVAFGSSLFGSDVCG